MRCIYNEFFISNVWSSFYSHWSLFLISSMRYFYSYCWYSSIDIPKQSSSVSCSIPYTCYIGDSLIQTSIRNISCNGRSSSYCYRRKIKHKIFYSISRLSILILRFYANIDIFRRFSYRYSKDKFISFYPIYRSTSCR